MVFRHKKTGHLYELVQTNVLFKDYKLKSKVELDSFPNGLYDIDKENYDWRSNDLVLYKALYKNNDGPYFVRHFLDFYNNFEEIES